MIVYQFRVRHGLRYKFANVSFDLYESPEQLTLHNRGTAYGIIKVELE